mmetsp:Transcript_19640/g.30770  ORF Transcript_19640/g.30770 Transcript_19640/m.30770 type:complete len:207 (-) Transcript_19640:623-1243(-)
MKVERGGSADISSRDRAADGVCGTGVEGSSIRSAEASRWPRLGDSATWGLRSRSEELSRFLGGWDTERVGYLGVVAWGGTSIEDSSLSAGIEAERPRSGKPEGPRNGAEGSDLSPATSDAPLSPAPPAPSVPPVTSDEASDWLSGREPEGVICRRPAPRLFKLRGGALLACLPAGLNGAVSLSSSATLSRPLRSGPVAIGPRNLRV